jgi:signal peptidase I
MRPATKAIVRDYGLTVMVAVLVALLIRSFLIEAYRIPSPAMRPALEPGDTIFVQKWSYRPERGDVVVYTSQEEGARDYIRRVIGLPGDRVQVLDGRVTVNMLPLEVNMDPKGNCGEERGPGGPAYPVCWEPPYEEDSGVVQVPDGSLFLLGDYRTANRWTPSRNYRAGKPLRNWAVAPIDAVKGRARWIWLSVEPDAGWFPRFRFDRMFRRIP